MFPLRFLSAMKQIALLQHMLLTMMFSLTLDPKLWEQIMKNWSNESKENSSNCFIFSYIVSSGKLTYTIENINAFLVIYRIMFTSKALEKPDRHCQSPYTIWHL